MNRLGRNIADDFTQAINDLIQRSKNFIAETHFTEFFPNLFYWIHLWCIWWDEKELYIIGDTERSCFMPCCPSQNNRVISSGYFFDKDFNCCIYKEYVFGLQGTWFM